MFLINNLVSCYIKTGGKGTWNYHNRQKFLWEKRAFLQKQNKK